MANVAQGIECELRDRPVNDEVRELADKILDEVTDWVATETPLTGGLRDIIRTGIERLIREAALGIPQDR